MIVNAVGASNARPNIGPPAGMPAAWSSPLQRPMTLASDDCKMP
jgi:hypothetical protein